jgi:hypothetical protein
MGYRYNAGMTDEERERWVSRQIKDVRATIETMPDRYLREYLQSVAGQLVIACADAGATDWPPNLHLADVIEKHLARPAPPRTG